MSTSKEKSDFYGRYASIDGIREIDLAFADFICRHSNSDQGREGLFQAALLASHVTGLQHAALDLKAIAKKPIEQVVGGESVFLNASSGILLPAYDEWVELLREQAIIGSDGDKKPLILTDNRLLYLYRYRMYECNVTNAIKRLCVNSCDLKPDKALLSSLFPQKGHGTDWQQVGALAAFRSRFCVISGGPGTGKTTTVAKVLALLLDAQPDLVIDMVAPTGKAADRLAKAVQTAKTRLGVSDELKKLIPEKASTIHRYLNYLPTDNFFRKNKDNRTASGLLVVDEASMVSLSLFAHLFDALPDKCRVILLGDKDQLASVEIGSVFGSIANEDFANQFSKDFVDFYGKMTSDVLLPTCKKTMPLSNRVIMLEHSYRFGSASGIGNLSFLVNRAEKGEDADEIMYFLKERSLSVSSCEKIKNAGRLAPSSEQLFEDIEWTRLPLKDTLKKELAKIVTEHYDSYLNAVNRFQGADNEATKVLDALNGFRILCAVHFGSYGVDSLNAMCEEVLFGKRHGVFYHGRPVIVLTNDYVHHLYNGDVGVVLRGSDSLLRVYFRWEDDSIRSFAPVQLPEHATAFAMTIHKSQGSEFDTVLVVLPEHDCTILTKEIVYTGITRAKKNVLLWCGEEVIKNAVCRRLSRTSGMMELFV